MANSNISFGYTNANNLKNKIEELQQVLQHDALSVCAISETFFTSDVEYLVPHYSMYRSDRHARGGGGVMLLVHDRLPSSSFSSYSDNGGHLEIVSCLIGTDRAIGVVCFYVSSGATAEVYHDLYIQLHDLLLAMNVPEVLIFGDLNLPKTVWSRGLPTNNEDLFDLLTLFDLTQLVESPTRYRRGDVPSLLDIICVPSSHSADDLRYLQGLGLSDHAFLRLDYYLSIPVQEPVAVRSLVHFDWTLLSNMIASIDWSREFEGLTTSQMWSVLLSNVDHWFGALSAHLPYFKSRSFRMTPDIANLIREKRRLWRRLKRNPTASASDAYTEACVVLRRHLTEAKIAKEIQLLNDFKSSPKRLYNYLKRKRSKQRLVCIKLRDGSFAPSADVPEIMLQSFVQKEESYGCIPNLAASDDIPRCPPASSYADSVVLEDIVSELRSIKLNYKHSNLDIHSYILKHCSEAIAVPLRHIFVMALDSASLPAAWKYAEVVPILKSGSSIQPGNYRPISILPRVAIIFERLVKGFLIRDVSIMDTLDAQHGYTFGRSCDTNLLAASLFITSAVDAGSTCRVAYLDLSAAFDLVPHHILERRMLDLGVHPHLVLVIRDYLSHRYRRVRVNGTFSSLNKLTKGVPQGSVLGPLLFKIFMSSSFLDLRSLALLYADDIKLLSTSSAVLQEDLQKVSRWAVDNGMHINPTKCAVLTFGRPDTTPLFLGATCLPEVNEWKDLGITFDNKLKFHSHVSCLVAKGNRTYHSFRLGFAHWTPQITRIVLQNYVRPVLEFSSAAWNTGYRGDAVRLEQIQRRFSKLPPSLRSLSYQDRLGVLHLPSLEARRQRSDLVTLFRLQLHDNGLFNTYFSRAQPGRRGHTHKLAYPQIHSEVGRRSFFFRTLAGWNALSEQVVGAPSVPTFSLSYDNQL